MTRLPWALVLASSLLGSCLVAGASLAAEEPRLELRGAVRASPPLPDTATFPFQLVLDDDAYEGVVGFAGPTARQFLWLNAFASPGIFRLQEIWVLFPAGDDVPAGGAIEILVYHDEDGDPSNGAELLASFDETIQAVDGETFSVYPVPSVLVPGSGRILIGVVNRFFSAGIDPPPTLPAALDTTLDRSGSYIALWGGDPPPTPDLASAIDVILLEDDFGGNFMIRGFGTRPEVVAVPGLSAAGLMALVGLLAAAAFVLLGRSRSRTPAPLQPTSSRAASGPRSADR